MRAPLSTATQKGSHQQPVFAFLKRDNGRSTGAEADGPAPTVMAGGGGKIGLITSNLVKMKGTCPDGSPVDQPVPTIMAAGNHLAEVRAFLIKYFGSDGQYQDCRAPLHTITEKQRFGLVTVAGAEYQIVDIGMRMLTPRELFRAQGFPNDYEIEPIFEGKPLSKTDQVRMCGNAVPPQWAEALVRANYVSEQAGSMTA